MRQKNLYEVTFNFKRGAWHKRLIHIEAYNMNEAKEEARKLWYSNYEPHMFDLTARRVPLDEKIDFAHWFITPKPR